MLYYQDGQRVTVWKIEDKGNYTLVQMSSSRKDKQNEGQWLNSSWSFVRFVGKAHEKASQLERGSRILLKGAGESQEPYNDDDGQKKWPKNPQRVVFNFVFADEHVSDNDDDFGKDTYEKESVVDEDDLPF